MGYCCMKTITFYSYKGGVGRTLTAANFSVYLANLGLTTVVIDFDLEAPGIDAKFGLSETPQKGLLDYILHFQQYNEDPGNIRDLCIPVALEASETESPAPLWIIPAGQYLSEQYYHKLSQLDWGVIFSQRDGVAFFQQFLAHIEGELKADFVIIDSRTGITESSGLCTQQLADEVIMLSSLSSESVKVTKHIKQLIEQSKIAQALGKSINVKVVVSRVPKPDDLPEFKGRCCWMFEVKYDKLFFVFSCPELEKEEFLVMNSSKKNEELISNYLQLFYALDLGLSNENILKEVEKFSSNILSLRPEIAERKVLELAAMYPHPEVYRTAMNFFLFTKDTKKVKLFAKKLLDLLPDDQNGQTTLDEQYLNDLKILDIDFDHNQELLTEELFQAIDRLHDNYQLYEKETIILYAKLLAKVGEYEKCLEVILPLCENNELNYSDQGEACQIARDAALNLKNDELAEKLAAQINNINEAIENADVPF